jgi:hypothetical protein
MTGSIKDTIRALRPRCKGPRSEASGGVASVLPEHVPDNVKKAAVQSRRVRLVELPGQAGLQRGDDRAVLWPVRIEVEDLSKLLGGEAPLVHASPRSLARTSHPDRRTLVLDR